MMIFLNDLEFSRKFWFKGGSVKTSQGIDPVVPTGRVAGRVITNPAEEREFVAANMDSDLQFILGDAGVSLTNMVSIARIDMDR